MSSFVKFSSLYNDSVEDVLGQLNDVFCEKLNYLFRGLEVELSRPVGEGFSYERQVKGSITDVQIWLSRPGVDVPLLMCRFGVKGVDQFGVEYSAYVKEHELLTKIPWQNFIPYENIRVEVK